MQRGARLAAGFITVIGITNLLKLPVSLYRSPFELMFVDLDGFNWLTTRMDTMSATSYSNKWVNVSNSSLMKPAWLVGWWRQIHRDRPHLPKPQHPLLCSRIIDALNRSFHIRGLAPCLWVAALVRHTSWQCRRSRVIAQTSRDGDALPKRMVKIVSKLSF